MKKIVFILLMIMFFCFTSGVYAKEVVCHYGSDTEYIKFTLQVDGAETKITNISSALISIIPAKYTETEASRIIAGLNKAGDRELISYYKSSGECPSKLYAYIDSDDDGEYLTLNVEKRKSGTLIKELPTLLLLFLSILSKDLSLYKWNNSSSLLFILFLLFSIYFK